MLKEVPRLFDDHHTTCAWLINMCYGRRVVLAHCHVWPSYNTCSLFPGSNPNWKAMTPGEAGGPSCPGHYGRPALTPVWMRPVLSRNIQIQTSCSFRYSRHDPVALLPSMCHGADSQISSHGLLASTISTPHWPSLGRGRSQDARGGGGTRRRLDLDGVRPVSSTKVGVAFWARPSGQSSCCGGGGLPNSYADPPENQPPGLSAEHPSRETVVMRLLRCLPERDAES